MENKELVQESLVHFMDRLEAIGEEHGEIYDTAVREALFNAVWEGFVEYNMAFDPEQPTYGMYTPEGQQAVRRIVLPLLEELREAAGHMSPDERQNLVWDYSVRSSNGLTIDEFLGAP